jgi:hypothetical protein
MAVTIVLLTLAAAGATVAAAGPPGNCSCVYTHTDFQCPEGAPCAPETAVDNVSSAAACGVLCLAEPTCYAAAWNGEWGVPGLREGRGRRPDGRGPSTHAPRPGSNAAKWPSVWLVARAKPEIHRVDPQYGSTLRIL